MEFHDIALIIVSVSIGGVFVWARWANNAIYELKSDVRNNSTKDDAQKILIDSVVEEIKTLSEKVEALTLAMVAANIKVKT